MPEDAFAFSPDPVGRTPWNPDTMTHRYRRYAHRVGVTSSLRNYGTTPLPNYGGDGLAALATVIGPQAGLDEGTALAQLIEFAVTD